MSGKRRDGHGRRRGLGTALALATSGAVLGGVGLTVAHAVPHSVQTSYLGSYAESTGASWNAAAALLLSSPNVRSEVTRSGPGVLASLLGSSRQASGLTIVGAFPPVRGRPFATGSAAPAAGGVGAVVRKAQDDDEPVAQLSGPVGPSAETAPTVELAVPLTEGHTVVAVLAARGPAPSLARSIQVEVAKIRLVLGAGLGLLWCALGTLAWRRHRWAMRGTTTQPWSRPLAGPRPRTSLSL